jgi:hypothetical protein
MPNFQLGYTILDFGFWILERLIRIRVSAIEIMQAQTKMVLDTGLGEGR